jgi:hypothetical protein
MFDVRTSQINRVPSWHILDKLSDIVRMKYREIIADNLSKAGWSWGCVSAIDSNGRTIWIADVHRGDGKRFVVHADEKLTAFVELEAAIRASSRLSWQPTQLFKTSYGPLIFLELRRPDPREFDMQRNTFAYIKEKKQWCR